MEYIKLLIVASYRIHSEKAPELKYIDLITWKNGEETSEFRLIDFIRDKCEDISRQFQVPKTKYSAWVNNNPGRACHELIHHWLTSGCGPYSVTWNGFIKVMEDVQLGEVAKQLKKSLLNMISKT